MHTQIKLYTSRKQHLCRMQVCRKLYLNLSFSSEQNETEHPTTTHHTPLYSVYIRTMEDNGPCLLANTTSSLCHSLELEWAWQSQPACGPKSSARSQRWWLEWDLEGEREQTKYSLFIAQSIPIPMFYTYVLLYTFLICIRESWVWMYLCGCA